MFRKISGFRINNIELKHTNERFEYFHHYWFLITSGQKYFFLENIKLESHRSLFMKINNQIFHNYKNAYDKIELFFLNNSCFQPDNIVIRDKNTLKNKISHIKSLVDVTTSKRKQKINFQKNEVFIKDGLKYTETQLLKRYPYEKRLANLLFKILTVNKPLSGRDKSDIKFLVNAFIVELYHYGYNIDYIKKVPDIILFEDHLYDFPYERTLADFSFNKEDFGRYKEEEKKKMNLHTMLHGIVNLVNKTKIKGFAVFKVEGIELEEEINFWDVTFYNPQVKGKIKVDPSLQNFLKLEFFRTDKDTLQSSTCNALVKTEFLLPDTINNFQLISDGYNKVKRALEVLTNILRKYGDIHSRNLTGKVNISKYFLVHQNLKIASFSSNLFRDLQSIEFNFNNENYSKFAVDEIEFFNSIDNNCFLGKSLVNIIQKQKEFENKKEDFNFKDIWIAWEALYKREDLIKLVSSLFRIYLNQKFLPSAKSFLSNTLTNFCGIYSIQKHYFLEQADLKRFDLVLEPDSVIEIEKFKRGCYHLPKVLEFEILQEMSNTLQEFLKNRSLYYKKLDRWISNTIDEVYAERNLEVHNNLKNELSMFKLKDDFITISDVSAKGLIRFLNSRNKNNPQALLSKVINRASKY